MIPHNRPTFGDAERQAAAEVLSSGWVAQGPQVAAFERAMCEYLGLPEGHAVAVSSGSAALFLALHVLGARGRRVGVPVYSCAALTNAVALCGASPVFHDVEADSPNIAAAPADADILIAAHMFGVPSLLSCSGRSPIVEDCAQALGAAVDGAPVGLQGAAGVFSFYATKMITSGGQGGMVVARDRGLIDAVRDYRAFDQREDRLPRFNLQMTDLQAAVGLVQLSRLPSFVARRAEIYAAYREAGLPLESRAPDRATPVRYRAILRCDNAARAIEQLATRGVRAIVPVEEWELLDQPDRYPNARVRANTSISLPIYPSLSDPDVRQIIQSVAQVLG